MQSETITKLRIQVEAASALIELREATIVWQQQQIDKEQATIFNQSSSYKRSSYCVLLQRTCCFCMRSIVPEVVLTRPSSFVRTAILPEKNITLGQQWGWIKLLGFKPLKNCERPGPLQTVTSKQIRTTTHSTENLATFSGGPSLGLLKPRRHSVLSSNACSVLARPLHWDFVWRCSEEKTQLQCLQLVSGVISHAAFDWPRTSLKEWEQEEVGLAGVAVVSGFVLLVVITVHPRVAPYVMREITCMHSVQPANGLQHLYFVYLMCSLGMQVLICASCLISVCTYAWVILRANTHMQYMCDDWLTIIRCQSWLTAVAHRQ